MLLAVPNLGVDRIKLTVRNVRAHVDLDARVLDLVRLRVGADVSIDEVDLEIDNVRVQAMLKVKLDKVADIVGDVISLLDHHPDILSNLTGGLGRGLEGALNRGSVEDKDDDEEVPTDEEQESEYEYEDDDDDAGSDEDEDEAEAES